jgi:hypothetical protein
VIFEDNGGFLTFYTAFKDALQVKTGVFKYWWDEYDEQTEVLEGKTYEELAVALQQSELVGEPTQNEDGTFDAEIKKPGPEGRACVKAFPPEDFTVAADTVSLAEATYCALRSRPRAQELIADGISRDIVEDLPSWEAASDEMERARDTAGEGDIARGGGNRDLRQVEIVEHYVRLEEGGKLQLWRVVTGGNESVLISKDKVERVQVAAITPYIVTHRFYGRSVADLLMEIQRIKTALTRNYLDSIYFANNQRAEIAMDRANEHTLSDFLRNEPGVPVRSRSGDAVKPLQAGGAGFDGLSALEYFSTVVEQRTGAVRNAQGLNPDTLHDTAQGAMALMHQAQKRIRLIARIFAETGVKDLFLGVHALLRKHSSQQVMTRLRNKWVPIDPSSWGERDDMTIEIGVGSGGKMQELMQIQQELALVQGVIEAQGGLSGPIIKPDNLYNLLKRFFEKGGNKAPEAYLSDPAEQEPQPPPPDPKLVEVQQKGQLAQAQAEHQAQLDQAKAVSDHQLSQAQIDAKHAQEMARIGADAALKRETTAAELELKRAQLEAELQLKREQMAAEQELQRQQAAHNAALAQQKTDHGVAMTEKTVSAKIGNPVEAGGEPG